MVLSGIFIFIALCIVCYVVLTFQLMTEHCQGCGKPARCNISWGVIYSKPFISRCMHCDAELNR